MNEITVRIKLYGILNQYIQNGEIISLTVPTSCTHSHLVENLWQAFAKEGKLLPEKMQELKQLIISSAFARNDEILDQDETNFKLQPNDLIAVLPPVCGG